MLLTSTGEERYVLNYIVGSDIDLGVECLRGSGFITSGALRAYQHVLTLTYACVRSVGISAYPDASGPAYGAQHHILLLLVAMASGRFLFKVVVDQMESYSTEFLMFHFFHGNAGPPSRGLSRPGGTRLAGMKVGKAHKLYDIANPQRDKNAKAFNCVQRGYQIIKTSRSSWLCCQPHQPTVPDCRDRQNGARSQVYRLRARLLVGRPEEANAGQLWLPRAACERWPEVRDEHWGFAIERTLLPTRTRSSAAVQHYQGEVEVNLAGNISALIRRKAPVSSSQWRPPAPLAPDRRNSRSASSSLPTMGEVTTTPLVTALSAAAFIVQHQQKKSKKDRSPVSRCPSS
ncbi:hypothetical protein ON010_g5564 [Phytophthora cinnamomi]|nr:hypothetical protein ON010_g5564 [Phytophthora cinnamomi]